MTQRDTSPWAVGWTAFAAAMMTALGFFHLLAGIVGLVQNELYVMTAEYLYELDVTTWGWIHLSVGLLVFLAGLSLLRGSTWARVVGVILAVISMVANFAWLPMYPLWAILMITVNSFVIWALTVHGRDIARH